MTILTRSTPKKSAGKKAVPFKLFFPRQLDADQARPVWEALEADPDVVLGDPFALPGVSTVYPGVVYARSGSSLHSGLQRVASLVEPLQETFPEELADGWVELWIPDGYEDPVEALDVTDLSGR
ncbi:hypothetical protein PBI_COLTRANE_67 [Microbacterium phage Coltrane]|uniref:DUF7252 domain-containing protein n=5 Tax=Armstrongvirus armstrong TaxID=2734217 RepID=A0A3G2KD70_9CAUD|nr:hypothetical protein HOU45_gp67 [Microbacterium phage Armstrong]AYN55938.1 hypothetical protein PBI_BRAHMS_67 [Microbacterium phage Brahms]AYN57044.1 hypothetical protein PBI_BERNSTEIN_67 [Microbacterium phage Bernstein]AYN57403.1 hypothetical protein PBI_COLTRANE_67 [Microbacterium phage Coltrane]AYN58991.1 hypothetical protein PBI_ROLLINS_67 [Microbacterium phage Rollins]UGL62034.1 hypothetical protein SEA_SKYLORD_67 [Microbacterium phage Skylord]UOK18222.1 hypothetical protein SEA_CLAYD